MQTVNAAAATAKPEREPLKLLKRLGSTTFMVTVRFSETSKETLEDKILRLIEGEVTKIA
jgi:hypothetical protein